MVIIIMATQNQPKHAPAFSKMHGWAAEGRVLSQRLTVGMVPGILAIAILAALILILASIPAVADRLGPNGRAELQQAGLVLTGLTGIGFLIAATVRGQRLFREHLRQAELVLAQTQAMIAATHDGVVVMDEHGRIQSVNPAGEKIFGQPVSRVLGLNITVLIPDRAVWQDGTALPRTTMTVGQRPSNQTFPLELNLCELLLDVLCAGGGVTGDDAGAELPHVWSG